MISFSIYLISFCWLLGFYFLWRIPRLDPPPVPAAIDPSEVSIIVPARNEANNLKILLDSLRSQYHPPGEIIVVDDHSVDDTSAIASKSGCRVIQSTPLPDGWAGKPWACWQGALQAKGKFLLFLDADTMLAPEGIHQLMTTYHKEGGLLTVQPYHYMERPYERLSAFFNIITMAGINAFTLLGDKLKPMGAFGPCNMCGKEDYFNVGGHEIVQDQILESLGLGRAFLKANLPVHCYGGKGVISFRMYPKGLSSMVEGFSKGFGIGAAATSLLSLIFIFCWIFGGVHLTRHLLQTIGEGQETIFFLLIALNIFYILQIHWMLRRIGNFGWTVPLFFQIPLIFFISVFFISLFKMVILRKTKWKERILTPKAE